MKNKIEEIVKNLDFLKEANNSKQIFNLFKMLFKVDSMRILFESNVEDFGFKSKSDAKRFSKLIKLHEENLLNNSEESFILCRDTENSEKFSASFNEFGYNSILIIKGELNEQYRVDKHPLFTQKAPYVITFLSKHKNQFNEEMILKMFNDSHLMIKQCFYTNVSKVLSNYLIAFLLHSPFGIISLFYNTYHVTGVNEKTKEILDINFNLKEKLKFYLDKFPYLDLSTLFQDKTLKEIEAAINKVREKGKPEKLNIWYTVSGNSKKLLRLSLIPMLLDKKLTENFDKTENIIDLNIIIEDITSEFREIEFQKEIEIAVKVQNSFLPSSNYENDFIEAAGFSIPAKSVGGDYYDYINFDDYMIGAIADVSGKGLSSALVMSSFETALRMAFEIERDFELNKCLAPYINKMIYQITEPKMFITAFYGLIHFKKKFFAYYNFGHNYPYLLKKSGETKRLDKGGTVLGIFPTISYELGREHLESGDIIFMFTDGVTEAVDVKDEQYGEERLSAVLESCRGLTAKEIAEKVLKSVEEFRGFALQTDDITLSVFRVK